MSSSASLCIPADTVESVQRGCIICGGPLQEHVVTVFDTRFGIPEDFELRRCTTCNLEQIFPTPSLSNLKALYESHYNFGGENGTVYTRLREWFFSSFLYHLWISVDGDLSFHNRKGSGRLIDIGCNEGRGLEIYARNGFQVEGCELNEKAAKVARSRGFTVHTCTLGDLIPPSLYDVAVLSNVLEHVPNPRQMLRDVSRILSPNGRIWISCPNSQSWLRGVFGRYWINWHVPFHISQFSTETLKNLLQETGFARVGTCHATPALWVAMSIITTFFAKRGKPTHELRHPLFVAVLMFLVRFAAFPLLWFQNRNGAGDCLLVSASKA